MKRRVRYTTNVAILASPYNAERLALGVATATVGPLTDRERKVVIEVSRLFSGLILDQSAYIDELADDKHRLILELIRCLGADVDAG